MAVHERWARLGLVLGEHGDPGDGQEHGEDDAKGTVDHGGALLLARDQERRRVIAGLSNRRARAAGRARDAGDVGRRRPSAPRAPHVDEPPSSSWTTRCTPGDVQLDNDARGEEEAGADRHAPPARMVATLPLLPQPPRSPRPPVPPAPGRLAGRVHAPRTGGESCTTAAESRAGGLRAWLDDAALTPGQKKRLAVFGSVEGPVCARIEEICGKGGVDVVDVAVLVIAPEARRLFFDDDLEPGVSVVIGHRSRLYAFLNAALPPAEDAPGDPYADLLEAAPTRCVRVMVVDDDSLTVMSYGTFVTVRVGPGKRAVA